MGRLIGYMANRADRLRDALHQEREVIAVPPSHPPAGWGIGFYQGGEVLHKKRPLLEGERIDWEQVANGVRSDCVIVHMRHATVGDFRSENTHPFRMRSWIFAHHGTIDRFSAVRERLLESMPDFIRRNIRGETDSEHFFHAVLSFLHDAGQLDAPDVAGKAVLNALRSAVRLVDRLGQEVGASPATLNLLLSNGRRMFALRRGSPMMLTERQGIHDPAQETDDTGPTQTRYVLVVSDGPAVPAGYSPIEEGSVCIIDRTLQVTTHPL
jgi:predicted glutamine amidotransferase